MNVSTLTILGISFGAILLLGLRGKRELAFERLLSLSTQGPQQATTSIDWSQSQGLLSKLNDKLGKAGFYSSHSRAQCRVIMWSWLLASSFVAVVLNRGSLSNSSVMSSVLSIVFSGSIGFVFAIATWNTFLSYRTRENARKLLFHIPLTLEAIILLVESGLDILPAIEKIVSLDEQAEKLNPASRLLKVVYQLTASGLPVGKALELVAQSSDSKIVQHVLLHLDVSSSEGGELIPSLRSLSEHAHNEWKLSVETRIKKLENLVVFPVFSAVLGLMALTAAVPLAPVFELKKQIDNKRQVIGASINSALISDR